MTAVDSKLIIENELITTDLEVTDKWEAIDKLSELLLTRGYVREEFPEKVKEREQGFPSALPTQPVAVAIPHTWAEHCIQPAIAVGILSDTVDWIEMGTKDRLLDVKVVLLFSITKPEEQVHFLRRVIDFFVSADNLEKLINHDGVESVRETLKKGLAVE